jgi:hypothetical protein
LVLFDGDNSLVRSPRKLVQSLGKGHFRPLNDAALVEINPRFIRLFLCLLPRADIFTGFRAAPLLIILFGTFPLMLQWVRFD